MPDHPGALRPVAVTGFRVTVGASAATLVLVARTRLSGHLGRVGAFLVALMGDLRIALHPRELRRGPIREGTE